MYHTIVRDYEVSIWTLQDSFVSVLKPFNVEIKGQIQHPEMAIKDDGTLTFKFTIPMYLYFNDKRIENPIWYNVRDGVIIENMRKIKVIFHKTDLQKRKIFEFLIIKVTDKQENGTLTVEVETEGLAFHELGKIGYKIKLNPQDFYNDVDDWFNNGYWIRNGEHVTTQPLQNINYWNDKIFKSPYSSINRYGWDYQVQMDWRADAGRGKQSNIIYEDDYVAAWSVDNNYNITTARYEVGKEKERPIEEADSNVYNLTQAIAEKFGVFCRYEYDYDDRFHIIGRHVIYYNHLLINDTEDAILDINYPYDATEVSRISDSVDIVTQMYVQSQESSNADVEVTIMDSPANKLREDYLLNFEYLHTVGAINDIQWNYIAEHEGIIKSINDELIPNLEKWASLKARIPELEANVTLHTKAIQLDNDRINASREVQQALSKDTKAGGDEAGNIVITEANPVSAVILTGATTVDEDTGITTTEKYLNLKTKGINSTTIKVYKAYNTANHTFGKDSEVAIKSIDVDEVNFPTRLNFDSANVEDVTSVYLTYTYEPQLYYKLIEQLWTNRLNNDTTQLNLNQAELEKIKAEITELEQRREELLRDKEEEISYFNRLMGPALREGYWSPEDYKDYGDIHVKTYTLNDAEIIEKEQQENELPRYIGYLDDIGAAIDSALLLDVQPFSGEILNYQDNFMDPTQPYYHPCIILKDEVINWIANNNAWDKLCFIYYDQPLDDAKRIPSYRKIYTVGSSGNYVLMNINGTTKIGFMITELTTDDEIISKLTAEEIDVTTEEFLRNADARLAIIDINSNSTSIINFISFNAENLEGWPIWVAENEVDSIVSAENTSYYLRLQVNSLKLNPTTANNNLMVKINDTVLTEYKDFSVVNRENSYFITIQPRTLIQYAAVERNGNNLITKVLWDSAQISFKYTISNAETYIFLDAQQIAKENSEPKVSYEVTIQDFNQDIIAELYKYLRYIVNINDTELQFKNVQGYISEIELDLDQPKNDKIIIKNYKTKFEDLFTKIIASTEQMQKNSLALNLAASTIQPDGSLVFTTVQDSINNINLQQSFNNGALTIDNANGIWAYGTNGVVAFSGGGLFTATEQDENGEWRWNTGILPSGINADAITTGRLDTNLINIYSGNNLRFQLNGDGIFAYKQQVGEEITPDTSLDLTNYVTMNEDGLFLIAKQGNAYTIDDVTYHIGQTYDEQTQSWININNFPVEVQRVAISWDGLTLRNYNNEPTLYADANTGNLHIKGTLEAATGSFTGAVTATSLLIGEGANATSIDNYLASKGYAASADLPKLYEGQGAPTNINGAAIGAIYQDINTQLLYSLATIANNQQGWRLIGGGISGTALVVNPKTGAIIINADQTVSITSNGRVALLGTSGIDLFSEGGEINLAGTALNFYSTMQDSDSNQLVKNTKLLSLSEDGFDMTITNGRITIAPESGLQLIYSTDDSVASFTLNPQGNVNITGGKLEMSSDSEFSMQAGNFDISATRGAIAFTNYSIYNATIENNKIVPPDVYFTNHHIMPQEGYIYYCGDTIIEVVENVYKPWISTIYQYHENEGEGEWQFVDMKPTIESSSADTTVENVTIQIYNAPASLQDYDTQYIMLNQKILELGENINFFTDPNGVIYCNAIVCRNNINCNTIAAEVPIVVPTETPATEPQQSEEPSSTRWYLKNNSIFTNVPSSNISVPRGTMTGYGPSISLKPGQYTFSITGTFPGEGITVDNNGGNLTAIIVLTREDTMSNTIIVSAQLSLFGPDSTKIVTQSSSQTSSTNHEFKLQFSKDISASTIQSIALRLDFTNQTPSGDAEFSLDADRSYIEILP